LCYITVQKGEDGMKVDQVPVPAAWAGDTSQPYDQRYRYYFPGEPEAKGFTPPKSQWGGKKKG
jgi:hypothetical protein